MPDKNMMTADVKPSGLGLSIRFIRQYDIVRDVMPPQKLNVYLRRDPNAHLGAVGE